MTRSDDATEPSSSSYQRDRRHVLGWFATVLATVSVAVGGWAHEKLSDHDVRIKGIEVQQSNDGQRQQRMEDKLDRIYDEIRKITR